MLAESGPSLKAAPMQKDRVELGKEICNREEETFAFQLCRTYSEEMQACDILEKSLSCCSLSRARLPPDGAAGGRRRQVTWQRAPSRHGVRVARRHARGRALEGGDRAAQGTRCTHTHTHYEFVNKVRKDEQRDASRLCDALSFLRCVLK